ncbi:hypothetical protein NET03_08375 [Thermomicrobium sp. CFH 73360]|uniref:MauE/DoxX family redox-associated membrane protein n=1 Tax=Thermomicrobium sp. CFH 73360 TaxID=2951987 RepID=UPI00207744F0|nr:MauE/DoxX family redox-associated membrane protein [Thermomicrobium sp. CFH 73360]MCM8746550.1 hypothetical protein [Thermomicrobium sp. CFH 73360]
MPASWSYHMTRASRRPTASHVALVLIALVLAVLVFTSFASSAVRSATANPVLLSLAGTDADEILVLDPRSGTVLNRIANPSAAVRQIFLSPRGDRALAYRVEEQQGRLHSRLELRGLPTWSLLAEFDLDSSIPPLQRLAAQAPEAAVDPSLFSASLSSDGNRAAVAFFTGRDWPILVVTALDLSTPRWADWALTVPGTNYAWLFLTETQLVVVASAMLPERSGYRASVHVIDPTTGNVKAEQRLPVLSPMLPAPGQASPSALPGVISVTQDRDHLRILTEDLKRITMDARTLAQLRVDPALTDELSAVQAVSTPEQVIVLARPNALLFIDNQRWQIRTQTMLPSSVESWTLVGYDAARSSVYIGSMDDGCLRSIDLSTATLSQPVACNLNLSFEWRFYYGWPVYAPGVAQPASVPATTSWMENLSSLATAVLAATFALAALGKTLTWRTSVQQLGTVLPALHRRTNVILAGLVAAETGTAVLLLLPFSPRVGLASATGLLLLFLGVSLFAVRRAPRQPCPCFGPLAPHTSGRTTTLRNLFLLGILLLAWTEPRAPTLTLTLLGLLIVLVVLNVSRLAAAVTVIRTAQRGATFDHGA